MKDGEIQEESHELVGNEVFVSSSLFLRNVNEVISAPPPDLSVRLVSQQSTYRAHRENNSDLLQRPFNETYAAFCVWPPCQPPFQRQVCHSLVLWGALFLVVSIQV